jgi:predicted kinase
MTALVAMVAVPGAGKSTWVRDRFALRQIVNLDGLRGWLADDEADQGATAEAVAVQRILIGGRCRRGLLTVADSTNLTERARTGLLALAHGMPTVAVVLDFPLGLCLARNAQRERRVPVEVIQEMHRRLLALGAGPVPGFSRTVRLTPEVADDVTLGEALGISPQAVHARAGRSAGQTPEVDIPAPGHP